MIDLSRTTSTLANLAAYQVGWFACVFGAAHGWGVAGASVAFALGALHALLADRPADEWRLLAAVTVVGIAADSTHAAFEILEFRGHQAGRLVPIWIVALWFQFGTVLRFCLGWLSRRYPLAAALGLVGGPLAFLAGERLGAASFGEPRAWSIGLLAVSWSVLLPALVWLGDRVSGASRYGPTDRS